MGIDRAATLKNAEKLLRQGKLEAAIAEYLRVVDEDPRDWNTGNLLGDLYARAGKADKAVEQFIKIADGLYAEGFLLKAAALYKKVLKITPDHEHALLQIGDIAGGQGLLVEARASMNAVLERRSQRADQAGVDEIVIRLAALDPEDVQARLEGARARVRIKDVRGAVHALKELAADLEDKGRSQEALGVLQEAGRLTAASAVSESQAQKERPAFSIAEKQLLDGRTDEAIALLSRLLDDDPSRRDDVARLGWEASERAPATGFRIVEMAVEAALSADDWPAAAATLQEFVTRVPNHIPALMRLVEVSVDGSLEATMFNAQAQLADAYIAAGRASEARFIAEDLVAREPWERSNIDRFRRALTLLGESDPDAVIASRLSGTSPFISTEVGAAAEDLAPARSQPRPAEPPASPAASPEAAGPSSSSDRFELAGTGLDLELILNELESVPPVAHSRSESVEVDLSIVLDDMQKPASDAGSSPEKQTADLDDVFARFREEAMHRNALDGAEAEFQSALELHAAGNVDACIAGLQSASRAPAIRFASAALLGRIYRERLMFSEAIEWMERAAEAPPPSAEDGRRLLYELADALEMAEEPVRSLAIFMELAAEAGEYRDVAERISRLSKIQARG